MSSDIQQKQFELGRMDIVDLYGWEKSKKLVTGPYFQRYSVWKDGDRQEFIDTIVKGFPIPSIFICEGEMNLETLQNTYYVLDGRQRLESIFKFMNNEFKYNGEFFKDFNDNLKKIFLNYSIPIIQIYFSNKDGDNKDEIKDTINEIFTRLNKNSYNLNKIEKQTSQYNEYDFIKICKIICGFIAIDEKETEEYNEELEQIEVIEDEIVISSKEEISTTVREICKKTEYLSQIFVGDIRKNKFLFTAFQRTRQINLQHLINIIGTLHEGILERNLRLEKTVEYSAEDFLLNNIKPMIKKMNEISSFIIQVLENGTLSDWWYNKSNLYTFMVLFYNENYHISKTTQEIIEKLNKFMQEPDFETYKGYCQNSVNNKTVRQGRNDLLKKVVES